MYCLTITTVLCLASAAFAEDSSFVNPRVSYLDGFAPESVSLTTSYRSKYVFSNGANLYDHGVVQSDLFVKTKCGFTLDIWTSAPTNLENFGQDFGTEGYYTLGYMKKTGDYNLSLGASYEDLHRNFKFEGTDFFILSGEVSRDIKVSETLSISPFFRVEVSTTPNGDVGSDTFLKPGARFSLKLTEFLTLTGKGMLVYDPGIYGGDVAWVGNIESSLMWKVGDHIIIELPYVRGVGALNYVSDGRKPEAIFGAGLTFKF
jgi:hypothetical protein